MKPVGALNVPFDPNAVPCGAPLRIPPGGLPNTPPHQIFAPREVQTTANHSRPLETTGNPWNPLESTGNHSKPLEITSNHSKQHLDPSTPLETARSHSRPINNSNKPNLPKPNPPPEFGPESLVVLAAGCGPLWAASCILSLDCVHRTL
jgi:hypothetical protein